MIAGLIFSKDRALQLDGMLRSFYRWCDEPDLVRLTVLYATSGDRFRVQYEALEREYEGRVSFLEEIDFRTQVLDVIGAPATTGSRWLPGLWNCRRIRASKAKNSREAKSPTHILFLVDDTLFVRPFSLRSAAEALETNRGALGFSFRLGANTVNSYAFGRSQAVPSFEILPNGVRKYRWAQADGDFAYPLELSSSFYRSETITGLVRGLRFSDPNTLESQMSLNAGRLRRRFPFLLCWEASVAFSAPVNRVQEVFQNRSGGAVELSVGSLANLFEAGQRLDLEALDGFVPTACHQEVSLALKSAAGSTRTGTDT